MLFNTKSQNGSPLESKTVDENMLSVSLRQYCALTQPKDIQYTANIKNS